MEIQIITDQKQWNDWLIANSKTYTFTQSWAWGDVFVAEGKKVEQLAVMEHGVVLAQVQVVYNEVFSGWQYAFCPQGPVFDEVRTKNNEESVYTSLMKYFNKKNILFFRVEPNSIIHDQKFNIHQSIDINPSATLILKLEKTEAELLAGMHPKTRYNIHLAEKKNLKIKQEKNLEVFWALMNKTGSRDKFGLHHKDHYDKVLASPMVYQLTIYSEDKPIACAVFVWFGNTFTYLYGASDYDYRSLMAPYLLQWEGIKMGKHFGCTRYDFFGVAPKQSSEGSYEYDQKHQYAGVTRFKIGFGGASQQMLGTFDFVINEKKYFVYGLLRKLRRLF
jgi:lipid II:glycine glycyltransferase (peptidoglycan interpeptide bridge formation enzyme)